VLSSARAMLGQNPLIMEAAVPPRSTVRRETCAIICSIELGEFLSRRGRADQAKNMRGSMPTPYDRPLAPA
jgi:hypothetical protein